MRQELPRYMLSALSLAGIVASVRFAVAPPVPSLPAVASQMTPPDRAAEAYAVLFARRYLTWDAQQPQGSAHGLEPFSGASLEADSGLQLPGSGEQHVEWAEAVQSREPAPGEHVFTVAAQTDTDGLLYLTVPVRRVASGVLALAGYPAFVGAPSSEGAQPPAALRGVSDRALETVVKRALRNYLGSSPGELAADLTADAHVSLPSMPLALESMQRLDWAQEGSAVLATVQAQDERGARYTLAYELNVVRDHGRWEISAVQTDPDS